MCYRLCIIKLNTVEIATTKLDFLSLWRATSLLHPARIEIMVLYIYEANLLNFGSWGRNKKLIFYFLIFSRRVSQIFTIFWYEVGISRNRSISSPEKYPLWLVILWQYVPWHLVHCFTPRVIWKLHRYNFMFYKFEPGYNSVEETKNICSAKYEGAVEPSLAV